MPLKVRYLFSLSVFVTKYYCNCNIVYVRMEERSHAVKKPLVTKIRLLSKQRKMWLMGWKRRERRGRLDVIMKKCWQCWHMSLVTGS